MRKLIKQRKVVDDSWAYAEENPQAAQLIVPLSQWQTEREPLLASGKQLGVKLAPADKVEVIANDLPRLSLVALEFPGLGEGRGYSQAHLLRRLGFKGELRAVGKIQRDQLFSMTRVGFDAYELPEGADLDVALTAFNDFSVAYYPDDDVDVKLARRA